MPRDIITIVIFSKINILLYIGKLNTKVDSDYDVFST